MGLFSKNLGQEEIDRLSAEIEKLSYEVAKLQGTQKGLGKAAALEAEIVRLKDEVADLKREKKEQEREIEHKLGLHRKQIEHEREHLAEDHGLAVDRAKLDMERDNLTTEREAFEKEMKFRTERFEAEVGYLREISEKILARLPDVNMAIKVGGGGNGATSEEKE